MNKKKLRADTNYTTKYELLKDDIPIESWFMQIEKETIYECENTCLLLAEIGKFDESIELALLMNLNEPIGYCLSKMVEFLRVDTEEISLQLAWDE